MGYDNKAQRPGTKVSRRKNIPFSSNLLGSLTGDLQVTLRKERLTRKNKCSLLTRAAQYPGGENSVMSNSKGWLELRLL